ncbi:alpha/beta hydrolase [Streptomyces sp. NPDC046215]|uniref:AB hydrolase-1 domain-containing protein n=1 Tax=Streptomyces stramineus TaxID=173861 RepID=A0ABN0ZIK3_9ACTN
MADAHAGPGAARPAAGRPPERGPAPCARELTVRTDDGVTLHVEIDEAPGPVPTVLFVNGLNTALWYWQQQREHLTGLARLAFFDHRGHGRSGPATVSGATVARLARDLAAVIETVAPRGPVVLVGHSVGGMAITALAAQRPELFGPRVVGAALIDTLPGRLADVTPLPKAPARAAARLLWRAPAVRAGLATVAFRHRRTSAVPGAPGGHLLQRLARFTGAFPSSAMFALLADVVVCDYYVALGVYASVATTVIAGEDDPFFPVRHKQRVAGLIPGARLVTVPRGGHVSHLHAPQAVNAALRDLAGLASASPRSGP